MESDQKHTEAEAMAEGSGLRKEKEKEGSSGRSNALERLKAAKASLEEQKGRSASARRFHTMSTSDRNEFMHLRHASSSPALADTIDSPHSPSTPSATTRSSSPESPTSSSPKSPPTLKTASSTGFLRKLREEKLGWTAEDDEKEKAKKEDEPKVEVQKCQGSGVGNFFLEERKRLQQEAGSSGSVVRAKEGSERQLPAGGVGAPSVFDVLQAGSIIRSQSDPVAKVKMQEKEKEKGPKPMTAAAWLSAKEQKRSLSTIKRTKEEKLKALEQLQSQLQQKRADINAHKEKQQQNEELLAQMVSHSIIIAPVVARGSRMMGKSIIDKKEPTAPNPAPAVSQPSPITPPQGGARLPSPRITITPEEAEEQKENKKNKKNEDEKEGTKMIKEKVKEIKKKKREEKMMDEMEKQLLKQSKKMDEERKNIQIDNQLSTFLTSLLTLESGFRAVEKEKIDALKKLDASEREREYLGSFLVCLAENIKRMNDGIKDVIHEHASDSSSSSSLFEDLRRKQQEMEEIVSATSSFCSSALPRFPSGEQVVVPSLPSLSSFASLSDLRPAATGDNGAAPADPAPSTNVSTPSAPPPPLPVDASSPSLSSVPPPPPALTSPPPPPPPGAEAEAEAGGGAVRGAMLAEIRLGSFDLKKVARRPPAPPPPSTAGSLFQSLQDTLVAAMTVRKLAMQGDDDDPDDYEWD